MVMGVSRLEMKPRSQREKEAVACGNDSFSARAKRCIRKYENLLLCSYLWINDILCRGD